MTRFLLVSVSLAALLLSGCSTTVYLPTGQAITAEPRIRLPFVPTGNSVAQVVNDSSFTLRVEILYVSSGHHSGHRVRRLAKYIVMPGENGYLDIPGPLWGQVRAGGEATITIRLQHGGRIFSSVKHIGVSNRGRGTWDCHLSDDSIARSMERGGPLWDRRGGGWSSGW